MGKAIVKHDFYTNRKHGIGSTLVDIDENGCFEIGAEKAQELIDIPGFNLVNVIEGDDILGQVEEEPVEAEEVFQEDPILSDDEVPFPVPIGEVPGEAQEQEPIDADSLSGGSVDDGTAEGESVIEGGGESQDEKAPKTSGKGRTKTASKRKK